MFSSGDPNLRADSFPVHYMEPTDASVLGLDLGSEPERLRAIKAAQALGRPVATGGVELAQGGTGILLIAPVQVEMLEMGRHFNIRRRDVGAGLSLGLLGGLFYKSFWPV